MVAHDGHVGQRDQQADRRSAVRLRRRVDRRSLRPAAPDDGRHRAWRAARSSAWARSPRLEFYFFYFFNALGYVCGGPLPSQVLLSRWFDRTRGKAMGIAYLGIGIGGAIVPLLAAWLTDQFGWRGSLQALGVLIVLIALPLAYFVREAPARDRSRPATAGRDRRRLKRASFSRRSAFRRRHPRTPGLLPARARQHVLDCRGRRHEPASEAVPQPRSRLLARAMPRA